MRDARDLIKSSMYGFQYGIHPYNGICAPDGTLTRVPFTHHNRVAQGIVESNPKWKEQYEQANKNRGYDHKEFLIIVKGYIFIAGGHFHFHDPATKAQERTLGVDPYREDFKMEMFFSD